MRCKIEESSARVGAAAGSRRSARRRPAIVCPTKPESGSSATHYCDCVATNFVVLEIPPSERPDVTAVEVSGSACTGPIESCDPVPGADAGQVGGSRRSEAELYLATFITRPPLAFV